MDKLPWIIQYKSNQLRIDESGLIMLMKKSLFLTELEKFLMELRNSTDMFENGMIYTSRPTESFEKCKESQQKREDNRSRRKNWIMLKTANEIEKALSSNNKDIVINGIMAMVFNLDDVNWISNHLIELSKHNNLEISSLALTCFGHLARLHGNVGNLECVSNLLKNMSKNVSLGGAAEDAMDDIETFMKINLRK